MKIFILIVFFLILIPPKIYAHVLESENSVGAVLHIEPEDDPVAKAPTKLIFEFKDKKEEFDVVDCACTLRIYRGDEIISTSAVKPVTNKKDTGTGVFTFPEIGSYTVNVVGMPSDGHSFDSFSLFYKVRVDREGEASSEGQELFKYLVLGIMVAVMVIFSVFQLVKKKNR